jgi:hypothetical protein
MLWFRLLVELAVERLLRESVRFDLPVAVVEQTAPRAILPRSQEVEADCLVYWMRMDWRVSQMQPLIATGIHPSEAVHLRWYAIRIDLWAVEPMK